jgi:hypothetical protein
MFESIEEVLALDVEVGECSVEPARKPPRCPVEQGHGGRHDEHPHDSRVEEHGDGEPDPEHLDHGFVAEHEAAEHTDHDECGRGDDAG